jgi:hypothetical protein
LIVFRNSYLRILGFRNCPINSKFEKIYAKHSIFIAIQVAAFSTIVPNIVGEVAATKRQTSAQPPIVIYNTGRDGCDPYDVPDAPARAFRDSLGVIHFFATSSKNRALIGKDFGSLKHNCNIVYQGAHDDRPQAYSDYSWLTSFYTQGRTIYALIHNEFHGNERAAICPSQNYDRCWENSLTLAISNDDGYHFKPLGLGNGDNVIAELPYRYKGDQVGHFGYLNPTNILKRGDFYYVMFSAIDRKNPSRSGVCIMRTSNLDDLTSWRAWDGSGFNTQFVNPYRRDVIDPIFHTCTPIGRNRLFFSLGSFLWMPEKQEFILIMRFQVWDKQINGEIPGVYYSISKDMINWSAPILLLSDEQADPISKLPQLYPSLIDPNSSDPNFNIIEGNDLLLYTITSPPNGGYKSWSLSLRNIELQE